MKRVFSTIGAILSIAFMSAGLMFGAMPAFATNISVTHPFVSTLNSGSDITLTQFLKVFTEEKVAASCARGYHQEVVGHDSPNHQSSLSSTSAGGQEVCTKDAPPPTT